VLDAGGGLLYFYAINQIYGIIHPKYKGDTQFLHPLTDFLSN